MCFSATNVCQMVSHSNDLGRFRISCCCSVSDARRLFAWWKASNICRSSHIQTNDAPGYQRFEWYGCLVCLFPRLLTPRSVFLADASPDQWPQIPTAKLGDFGLACLETDEGSQRSYRGTKTWKAPVRCVLNRVGLYADQIARSNSIMSERGWCLESSVSQLLVLVTCGEWVVSSLL